jgi:hypothetical protein
MTATGTPVRMQHASIPSPAPAPAFGQAQADEFDGSGIGRGRGGEGVDMKVLEDELQTLLTFVKSGYTNATHQESEWMQVPHTHIMIMCTSKRGRKTPRVKRLQSFLPDESAILRMCTDEEAHAVLSRYSAPSLVSSPQPDALYLYST